MRKIIFIFLIVAIASVGKGQTNHRIHYTTTIGTGISMSEPSYTPFTWQVTGNYRLSERFSAGIGTGLSFYEETLIPVFADLRFRLSRPHKFTPYLQGSIGYAFAPSAKANGGYYLHPSIGVEYAIHQKVKLLLGIGYEIQNLERLKEYENGNYQIEFSEKLNHNTVSIKLGCIF